MLRDPPDAGRSAGPADREPAPGVVARGPVGVAARIPPGLSRARRWIPVAPADTSDGRDPRVGRVAPVRTGATTPLDRGAGTSSGIARVTPRCVGSVADATESAGGLTASGWATVPSRPDMGPIADATESARGLTASGWATVPSRPATGTIADATESARGLTASGWAAVPSRPDMGPIADATESAGGVDGIGRAVVVLPGDEGGGTPPVPAGPDSEADEGAASGTAAPRTLATPSNAEADSTPPA